MKMTISFTLDTERDGDLMRWLDGLPKRGRSEAIRDALRASLGGVDVGADVTLADVYEAVLALQKVARWDTGHSTGAAAASTTSALEDEPPDIADSLDRLGL